MNKQRKVLITITYNEMGIIIDTKAEEVAQPNLQPTCNQLATDAISRQAVLDLIADYDLSMGQVVKGIHALPPVTPQPKTGHWIRWYEQKEHDGCIEYRPHCKCSECGKEYDSHSSRFIKYCNECGAKMVESEE